MSERFGLSLEELVRTAAVAVGRLSRARSRCTLSRELTDSSLPKIGKEFGGRDHTTVMHATSKITRLISEDRSVYNLVQELTARVKQAAMNGGPASGLAYGVDRWRPRHLSTHILPTARAPVSPRLPHRPHSYYFYDSSIQIERQR